MELNDIMTNVLKENIENKDDGSAIVNEKGQYNKYKGITPPDDKGYIHFTFTDDDGREAYPVSMQADLPKDIISKIEKIVKSI